MSESAPTEPVPGPGARRIRGFPGPGAMRMLARPPLLWTIVVLVFAGASLVDFFDNFGQVKIVQIRVSWLTFAILATLWLPTLLRVVGAFAMRPPRRRWRARRGGPRPLPPPPPRPPHDVLIGGFEGVPPIPVEPEPDD